MIEQKNEIGGIPMRISNAKIFQNGRFTDGGIEFGEKITAVGGEITGGEDAGGCYVIPGLVDIHTHGAVGEDASDGSAEGLAVMSRHYARGGVTSFCPTTATVSEAVLTKAMEAIGRFERPANGAKVVGVHLEGPFLCYTKRGAQAAEHLRKPDTEIFRRLNEVSGGLVKLVTVAPEEPGALEFIREISKICTVSLGHTAADYGTAMAAFEAGAAHVTHLYNGMPSLHHREPGVIAAAADAGATVELITDGLHIHPAVVRLTHRLFGEDLVLISDSLRCAGMPDGEYELGGQPVTMKGGKATLTGTDTLAGSSIHLMEGLRRAVSFGVPLEAAVTAVTLTPAKAIRVDGEIGSLDVGKWADLVVLDDQLNVKAIYINGKNIL